MSDPALERVQHFRDTFARIKAGVQTFIVGQDEILDHCLMAIICGGHVLLEGVPGLGKTAMVNTLAKVLDLSFRRIQFTPDLLPADIVGTNILIERGSERIFQFQPGPVFCNILLADEINRATPKTQSALLETMQEKAVTVANSTHRLGRPFFVLATQNPIESEGTYPLPEAQLDRFFFKLLVKLPSADEFAQILRRTGGSEEITLSRVACGDDLLRMGELMREVPIADEVLAHLVAIVRATHPDNPSAPDPVKRYIRHGASPRAAQAMLGAARCRALLAGRYHVGKEDVAAVAAPALRHRLILSFEGSAEGIQADTVVRAVLERLNP